MLNKKRTAGRARLRLLLVLPLGAAMLCTSTMAFTKDYGFVDLFPEKSNEIAPIQEKPKVENIKKQQPPKVQEIKKPKTDVVKFPPPIVDKFFPMRNVDENGEINFIDQRYIVINGKKIKDINTFFGVTNITKIVSLNQKNAKKKYGAIAKYGAIEITGNNLMYVKSLADGPPSPIMTQAKFPPPIVKPNGKDLKNPPPVVKPAPINQTSFSPRSELKHDGKEYLIVKPDNRYIVINGNPVSDMYKFYGVMNTKSVTILTPNQATKIYGLAKGKYGAVEIKGDAIEYVPGFVGPPPPTANLELDRNKGDLLKIPSTNDEIKTLTVYNNKGKVIYNSTNYNDDWDGKTGNYKEFANQKIASNSYSFLVKISGKQFSNIRGKVIIK